MYSFLVLGLIPGTNIQITFEIWAEAAVVLSILFTVYSFIKRFIQERRFNPDSQTDDSQSVIDTTQLYPSA